MKKRPGLVRQAGQRCLVRAEIRAVKDDGGCAPVQLDLSVSCHQAGRVSTVNTLCISWKVWEQVGTPPQQDGQLLVAAGVCVAWASVSAHTNKLHVSEGTLGQEGTVVYWLFSCAWQHAQHQKPQTEHKAALDSHLNRIEGYWVSLELPSYTSNTYNSLHCYTKEDNTNVQKATQLKRGWIKYPKTNMLASHVNETYRNVRAHYSHLPDQAVLSTHPPADARQRGSMCFEGVALGGRLKGVGGVFCRIL